MQQHPTTPLPRSTPLYNTERERDSIEESCNLPSSQFTPHPRVPIHPPSQKASVSPTTLPPAPPARQEGRRDGAPSRFSQPLAPLSTAPNHPVRVGGTHRTRILQPERDGTMARRAVPPLVHIKRPHAIGRKLRTGGLGPLYRENKHLSTACGPPKISKEGPSVAC
ncbi:hypothetical protein QE152_g4510 [Popillia japonica]|uniref:Uncharacterized protein n=1 Tax=Popillia japonica TaxID=7064 RepID=A0AAW1N043_POPJA